MDREDDAQDHAKAVVLDLHVFTLRLSNRVALCSAQEHGVKEKMLLPKIGERRVSLPAKVAQSAKDL